MKEQPESTAQQTQTLNQETLLDKIIARSASIVVTEKGIDFENFTGLLSLANMIWKSKMYPYGLDSIESIALAIARGRTVGLDAFQSMESMAVIGGRVMIFGDAPLAIARQHPLWDESGFDEYFKVGGKRIEGNPEIYADDTTHISVSLRKGASKPVVSTFSVADAKRASLWEKKNRDGSSSTWHFYPFRLLKFRSRGYGLRDNFGDALKGILIRELHEDDELPVNGNQPKAASELDEKIREKQAENVNSTASSTANSIPASLNKVVPSAFTPPPQSKNQTPKPIIETLGQDSERGTKSENSQISRQDAPESTIKNPIVKTPGVETKPNSSPKSSSIPRKRNESPAFKMASDEIKGYLAKVTEPEKIKEEMLYEASHDGFDGDFLTLQDVEDGVGKLHVYQRAASGLRDAMGKVNEGGVVITDSDVPF